MFNLDRSSSLLTAVGLPLGILPALASVLIYIEVNRLTLASVSFLLNPVVVPCGPHTPYVTPPTTTEAWPVAT